MFEYSQDTSWAVDRVRFEYLGRRYHGRGLLKWSIEQGFHLDAFLDSHGTALPNRIQFGKVRVPAPSELRSVRMRLEGFGHAITPQLTPGDQLELIGHSRLDVDFPSLLFSRPFSQPTRSEKYYGAGLFELGEGLVLPDRLERVLRLSGQQIQFGVSAGGIKYEDESLKLRAWLESQTQLRMEWTLSGNAWCRTDAWKFAEGAEAALSFLGGRTVRLLERSTRRGSKEYIERRKRLQPVYLGILSLPPRATWKPQRIDKGEFVALTRFFTSGGKDTLVAQRMCVQMAEVCRQDTLAAKELLCANILDAGLRTLAGKPYKRSDPSTKIEANMAMFCAKYFSNDVWKGCCEGVVATYHDLRHRNAHPDWLTTEGGGLSDNQLERSLDGMIRLSWFYGYMILAMAGFKSLEPKFPCPHKDWDPLITITREHTA